MNLKVSAFYLKKQKSFIPKKKIFKPLSISKQKSFVYRLNFPEGFAYALFRHSDDRYDQLAYKVA